MHTLRIAALLLIVDGGLYGDSEPGHGATSDACKNLIPAPLAKVLTKDFPDHRLPAMADNSVEDVRHQRESGGTGCLGVTSGDFDGNGTRDLAVVLTPRTGGDPVLVAALRTPKNRNGWQVSTLRVFKGVPRARIYVDTLKPAEFQRTDSAEGNLETGELTHFSSRNEGIATGLIESAEIAYFFTGGRWVHVWVAD